MGKQSGCFFPNTEKKTKNSKRQNDSHNLSSSFPYRFFLLNISIGFAFRFEKSIPFVVQWEYFRLDGKYSLLGTSEKGWRWMGMFRKK